MLLFSIDPECRFAHALASELGESLSALEDRAFEDGEHKLRPLVDPRGHDAYVIASLYGGPLLSPHDKLFQLLMFSATLREHGAGRVTAVVPYLAYARKDRQTKPHDPLTLRYVAQLFEAVGIAQVIVLEAHNVAAFQNAFRCLTLHVPAHEVFDPFVHEIVGVEPLAVASPDPGGVKRAQLWRESLEHRLVRPVGFAMVDKRRSAGLISSSNLVAGDVDGMTVLLLDDLIAGGDTMKRAADALRRAGAHRVVACAAHGLFTAGAPEVLAPPAVDQLLVTDSVPPFRLPVTGAVSRKLRIVSAAPRFADAIRACRVDLPG
ncbi:MAG: ribose-phosphate diphosphokinase [Burkholderiaceae bacterium]|nr:ribose-phosphate diphosphokinase [Burkholderiaceae bacterium]